MSSSGSGLLPATGSKRTRQQSSIDDEVPRTSEMTNHQSSSGLHGANEYEVKDGSKWYSVNAYIDNNLGHKRQRVDNGHEVEFMGVRMRKRAHATVDQDDEVASAASERNVRRRSSGRSPSDSLASLSPVPAPAPTATPTSAYDPVLAPIHDGGHEHEGWTGGDEVQVQAGYLAGYDRFLRDEEQEQEDDLDHADYFYDDEDDDAEAEYYVGVCRAVWTWLDGVEVHTVIEIDDDDDEGAGVPVPTIIVIDDDEDSVVAETVRAVEGREQSLAAQTTASFDTSGTSRLNAEFVMREDGSVLVGYEYDGGVVVEDYDDGAGMDVASEAGSDDDEEAEFLKSITGKNLALGISIQSSVADVQLMLGSGSDIVWPTGKPQTSSSSHKLQRYIDEDYDDEEEL